jgi:6-phosphogluconolactonase
VPVAPHLPSRVVIGGYSLDPQGDGPEAGTGLRVLDLDGGASDGPRYVTVGHEPLLSPTWVVPHPRRPWLVSVTEAAPSEVVCTRVEADGALRVLGRRATGGDFGCHLALSADGSQVVVAHYGSGTVETFALDDEGQLAGPLDRFTSTAPLGPDPDRQDGPHAHQAVLDPHRPGEVLVCDLGTDRVHRLRLHPDGRLTEAAPALVLPPGFGPRHLVVVGDMLVVAGELAGELWLGRRDDGGWQHTQTLPTTRRTAEERARSSAPALPSALRVVGDQVVVATRGIDTVSVLALDRERSTVSFVAEVSCLGHHPRDLVVADGLVWIANQWSDELVVLDLSAVAAGHEGTSVHRSPTVRPACIVLLDHPSPAADDE